MFISKNTKNLFSPWHWQLTWPYCTFISPLGKKKKVIKLFCSSLPLTFLYTGHTLARKKVGAFISLEDLFVYCRVAFSTAIWEGQPASYCLMGTHKRIWKLKETLKIIRAIFPLQMKKQSPDQWYLMICPRSHGQSVTVWKKKPNKQLKKQTKKPSLSSCYNAGS